LYCDAVITVAVQLPESSRFFFLHISAIDGDEFSISSTGARETFWSLSTIN
jgi:hypothetical protein